MDIKVLSGHKADDPNKSALTLELSKSSIGGLDDDILRVMISKGEAATEASPFAKNIFDRIAVLQRVDLLSKQDDVWVTFHIHPTMVWGEAQVNAVVKMLSDYLDGGNQLVNSQQLKAAAECYESMANKDGIDKKLHEIFRDTVNPLVAQHRGALELIENKRIPRKGLLGKSKGTDIVSVVAAFGACGNCPISGTTLKMAAPLVSDELDAYLKDNPSQDNGQTKFKDIEILKRGKGLVILTPKG